jgi:hypothetical protein
VTQHCPHCAAPLVVSPTVREWLLNGERGISSEAILTHLTGLPILRWTSMSPPSDAHDVRRCRLLLEAVPELVPNFDRMREVNKYWAAVVDAWPDICLAMDLEWPQWRLFQPFGYSRRVDELLERVRQTVTLGKY